MDMLEPPEWPRDLCGFVIMASHTSRRTCVIGLLICDICTKNACSNFQLSLRHDLYLHKNNKRPWRKKKKKKKKEKEKKKKKKEKRLRGPQWTCKQTACLPQFYNMNVHVLVGYERM